MTMRREQLAAAMIAAWVMVWVGVPAQGDPPPLQKDDAAAALHKKVVQAYQQTQTYRSDVRLTIHSEEGRWNITRSATFQTAWDRPGRKLLLDTPVDLLVVSDGAKLRMGISRWPGQHLEVDTPDPLNFDAVLESAPWLDQSMLPPDLTLLLDGDWGGSFRETTVRLVEPTEDDPQQKRGLQFQTDSGSMTLWVNPATHLVTKGVLDVDTGRLGGATDSSASMVFEVHSLEHDQPLPDDTFAFDTSNSKACATLEELQQMIQSGGQADLRSPLKDQDAPPIELSTLDGEPFTLDNAEADLVVLDFWATWCNPCVEGLPKLQAYADWAKQQGLSVAVYAVNLREEAQQVRDFWQQHGLTMTVLMDPDGEIANAYQVEGIPQTVMIHNGKVVMVQVGLDPQLDQMLQERTQQLLGSDEASESGSDSEPASEPEPQPDDQPQPEAPTTQPSEE